MGPPLIQIAPNKTPILSTEIEPLSSASTCTAINPTCELFVICRKKMYETPTEPARIEPDRKWFGNTRVADQKLLD